MVGLMRRSSTDKETTCADRCTEKNYNVNNKILNTFIIKQSKVMEKKLEMVAKEAEAATERMRAEGMGTVQCLLSGLLYDNCLHSCKDANTCN